MSDTVKKLSEYADLNLELPWDELKEQFDKKFTTIEAAAENDELVNKIMGRTNAALRALVTKISGELGVEGFNKSEIADMKSTDIIENFGKAVTGLKSNYSEQLEETKKSLAEAQKNGGSKKDSEEWQQKYQQLETKYNDATGLLESVKGEYEGLKTQVEQEKTESFFNAHKEKAFEGLKLKAENEYTIKGFKSDVFSGIKLDRDGDNVVVRDASTNERIKHPEKAGAFMELPDYIRAKAAQAGLLETDPNRGKTVTKTLTQPGAVVPNNGGGNGEFANHRPPAAPIFEKK